jgi:protein gp37
MTYTQHPLSAAFPPMSAPAYAEFRADIAANGVHHSTITIFEDRVLEGWHRYCACGETGRSAELRFDQFPGDAVAALRFVISANMHRRHLNESQRGIIAAKLIMTADQGVKLRVAAVSEQANVSEKTITDATQVVGSGNAELLARVEAGEVAVSRAAKEVRATKRAQTIVPFTPQPDIAPRTAAQWKKLSPDAQQAHLAYRNPRATLNQQKPGEDDNLIDWAAWTLNVIVGCNHPCPYCYARDIAERFRGTAFPHGFEPTFHPERLSAPLNQVPPQSDDPRDRRVFLCSMADPFGRWVPREWIEAILEMVRRAPAWTFLILTKFPQRVAEFDIPDNLWVGTSIDFQARVKNAEEAFARLRAKVKFISAEPLCEPLQFSRLDLFDFIIIGGATRASKTPDWKPPLEWVADLRRQADAAGVRVYEKSNLLRKEEPGGGRYGGGDELPAVFRYLGRGG